MSADKLIAAVSGVDWNDNVAAFQAKGDEIGRLAECALRLAIWSRQIETAEEGNPALSFIREMQTSTHSAVALAALALYKPAAASLRTMVEAALYYTFFRSHPAELASVARQTGYYITRTKVIEYHLAHTPGFGVRHAKLGLDTKLNSWYPRISAIIHGQLPGTWVTSSALSATKLDESTLAALVDEFAGAEEIIHRLFLSSVAPELWTSFSAAAKGKLLKGLTAEVKAVLALDKA